MVSGAGEATNPQKSGSENDTFETRYFQETIHNLSTLGLTALTRSFRILPADGAGAVQTGAQAKRPDPVHEVCDIQVKIADLGNACWTVGAVTADLCGELN